MKKAIQQAFGDLDEKVKAAQKLQRLRQVRSVREYITNFRCVRDALMFILIEFIRYARQVSQKRRQRKGKTYSMAEAAAYEDRASRSSRNSWKRAEASTIGFISNNELTPLTTSITTSWSSLSPACQFKQSPNRQDSPSEVTQLCIIVGSNVSVCEVLDRIKPDNPRHGAIS